MTITAAHPIVPARTVTATHPIVPARTITATHPIVPARTLTAANPILRTRTIRLRHIPERPDFLLSVMLADQQKWLEMGPIDERGEGDDGK